MEHFTQKHTTIDDITWHIEQFRPPKSAKEPQTIVLVPSGEGDCHNLTGLARILCEKYQYTVITFDNPGFSRTTAPLPAYDRVTSQLAASQIQLLLSELGIKRANAFGCSSGGLTVLGLIALYPELINCGIIHEVPFECPPPLLALKDTSDDNIQHWCAEFFSTQFIEDSEKWNALGSEYHERLKKNYVTWVRHVVNIYEKAGRQLATPENLTKRPLFWTVGSLNPGVNDGEGIWKLDFVLAKEAGLKVDTTSLKCLHFPAVSIPEATAEWIDSCVSRVQEV